MTYCDHLLQDDIAQIMAENRPHDLGAREVRLRDLLLLFHPPRQNLSCRSIDPMNCAASADNRQVDRLQSNRCIWENRCPRAICVHSVGTRILRRDDGRDARGAQSHQTSVHRKANAVSALPRDTHYPYRDGNHHFVLPALSEVRQGFCD